MNYRTPICVLVMALCVFLPLYAQDKKETTATANADAPPPTNLKVLKVATRAEAEQIMRTFAAGLGVQCNYCHVADFASDENPKKEVARRMIKMIQKINEEFPDGKMHVSCYTCHRGETEPKTAPRQ